MNKEDDINALNDEIPCREEQFKIIKTFIEKRLHDQISGCMYICGMPGTGKTATVNYVISELQKDIKSKRIRKFNLVSLNCMHLSNPRQSYVEICKQLWNKKFPIEKALNELEEKFTDISTKKIPLVLLIDELDALCEKQDVIYNLFNWVLYLNSKLIIISIANTIDLPERFLEKKIYSRLGLTRLVFQPYNYNQLCAILKKKVFNNSNIKVNNDAIEMIARKVASVSGDVRSGLEICSLITESNEEITIELVVKIMKRLFLSPQIEVISRLSKLEQSILEALQSQDNHNNLRLRDIYPVICSMCVMNGINVPSMSTVLGATSNLEAMRLVLNINSINDNRKVLQVNINSEDLKAALKTDS